MDIGDYLGDFVRERSPLCLNPLALWIKSLLRIHYYQFTELPIPDGEWEMVLPLLSKISWSVRQHAWRKKNAFTNLSFSFHHLYKALIQNESDWELGRNKDVSRGEYIQHVCLFWIFRWKLLSTDGLKALVSTVVFILFSLYNL